MDHAFAEKVTDTAEEGGADVAFAFLVNGRSRVGRGVVRRHGIVLHEGAAEPAEQCGLFFVAGRIAHKAGFVPLDGFFELSRLVLADAVQERRETAELGVVVLRQREDDGGAHCKAGKRAVQIPRDDQPPSCRRLPAGCGCGSPPSAGGWRARKLRSLSRRGTMRS